MAYTCSYQIGSNEIVKDANCFSRFTGITTNKFIIIEKNKSYFEISVIRKYLNDLKKYFNFTYRSKNGEFRIDCSKIGNKSINILFCMIIRFLWEGKKSSYKTDHFYKVVIYYFKLKKLYSKDDNFKLLCIACNCFIFGQNSYNSNHFPSLSGGCRIDAKPNEIKGYSVNEFFSKRFKKIQYDYPSEPKDWEDSDYEDIKTLLTNEK